MKVPFLDIQARYQHKIPAIISTIESTICAGRFVGGPAVSRFEQKMAELFGAEYAIGVANGTDALSLSLKALDVQPGDEVIIPAVSFFATAGAVLRIGAKAVIVDVQPDRPLIDPQAVKEAITEKSKAVIPVHLFGDRVELPELSIPIVDDSAQAVGAQPPAFHGVMAGVSFYPSKILGAFGDGGMVICQDQELAMKIRTLANHGQISPHYHQKIGSHFGINSRLDAIQAEILLLFLEELPRIISDRKAIMKRYQNAFGSLAVPKSEGAVPSLYVIRHPRRDIFQQRLAERGIGSQIYYPYSLAQQPCLERRFPTPYADAFCAEALALPCYEGMSDIQVEMVIDAILDVLSLAELTW